MKISYKTNRLEKTMVDLNSIKRFYGTMAKAVNQRKIELSSVNNLEEMKAFPKANCHELTGDRDGELAVDVSPNHRIIFKPDYEPKPLNTNGGLDWVAVTQIKINDIAIDYH